MRLRIFLPLPYTQQLFFNTLWSTLPLGRT
jgi:hypothetical protein